MVHYVEEDNRLIKESDDKSKQKSKKNQVISDNKNTVDLLESHGLSRNARILTE